MLAIAQKLQIKPNSKWLFFNAPDNYLALLEPLPENVIVKSEPDGNFDGIQLFVKSNQELSSSLALIAPLLNEDTIFWLTYPKKSSGLSNDLTMMDNKDLTALYGLRPVTSIAISDTWTALRFKPSQKTKISATGNSQIKQNEYAGYIDVDNKTITLPPVIKGVLEQNPIALSFYLQLSYTNKKEYVLWILTAKQEKTREERLIKLLEKLTAGKKNPSEK
jgi:hypothetical protein